MKRPHIVFLDAHTLNPGDLDWKCIKDLGEFTAYERTERENIISRSIEADIIITNKTVLRREHFEKLPKLRLICVAATGFDVIDVAAAREFGIRVCNCAGYGTRAVAQMVVAHLLEVANRVGHYTAACHSGFWSQQNDFCSWNNPLMELQDKKMGVIGFGNIGREVINLLRPFGMLLFAVTSKTQQSLPADVCKVTLEEAFSQCDVISLHCPLMENNKKMVNEQLLNQAKKGLILINTARGKLIDETAVAKALGEGRLGAFCCDVLSKEPPEEDNPILSSPNTFITPHIAWATPEARQRILEIIVNNIKSFQTGTPINVVN